ncbi:hypothetical protein C8R43DRAFT_1113312 [Mycena crocata]|nr:hypothetical protein C8R43DRAFT_1113312 [Mycena crocata]
MHPRGPQLPSIRSLHPYLPPPASAAMLPPPESQPAAQQPQQEAHIAHQHQPQAQTPHQHQGYPSSPYAHYVSPYANVYPQGGALSGPSSFQVQPSAFTGPAPSATGVFQSGLPPSAAPALHPTPSVYLAPTSSDAGSDGEQDRERDRDGGDGPPKKKRRRQALSCTECKRRKIRCDRTQPCSPCVRRGDQAKCQWHAVEPAAEKYVPRSEHDALRADHEALGARMEALERLVGLSSSGSLGIGGPSVSTSAAGEGIFSGSGNELTSGSANTGTVAPSETQTPMQNRETRHSESPTQRPQVTFHGVQLHTISPQEMHLSPVYTNTPQQTTHLSPYQMQTEHPHRNGGHARTVSSSTASATGSIISSGSLFSPFSVGSGSGTMSASEGSSSGFLSPKNPHLHAPRRRAGSVHALAHIIQPDTPEPVMHVKQERRSPSPVGAPPLTTRGRGVHDYSPRERDGYAHAPAHCALPKNPPAQTTRGPRLRGGCAPLVWLQIRPLPRRPRMRLRRLAEEVLVLGLEVADGTEPACPLRAILGPRQANNPREGGARECEEE